MSFFSKGFDALKSLTSGFAPQKLTFGDITVITTALLAEGGFSYVYSAREVGTSVRQFAAKKVIAQDKETERIAETETRLLQQLNGQVGFVRCYGGFSRQTAQKHLKEYWMLLEFCPNGSLIDLLYKKGKGGAFEKRPPLPTIRVLEIFEELCTAVAHLHALQPPVAHRDMKLENVLIAADGRCVLCDFGSASTSVLPAERTRKQAAAEDERIQKYSTLMYRAPEMVDLYREQEVGPKVDVWALGCILFALAYGDHPFADESSLQILNARYTIPPTNAHPKRIAKLVQAVLTPDPTARPPVKDVLEATRRLLAAERMAPHDAATPCPATSTAATATPPRSTTSGPAASAASASVPTSTPPPLPPPPPGEAFAAFEANFDEASFELTPASSASAEGTDVPSSTRGRVHIDVQTVPASGGAVRVQLSFGGGSSEGAADARSACGDAVWEASFEDRGEKLVASAGKGASSAPGPPTQCASAAPAKSTSAVPTPPPAAMANDDDFGAFTAGGDGSDGSDDDEFGEFSAGESGRSEADAGGQPSFGDFQS